MERQPLASAMPPAKVEVPTPLTMRFVVLAVPKYPVPRAVNAVVDAYGAESLPVVDANVKEAAAAKPPPLLNWTCESDPATVLPEPPWSAAHETLPEASVVSLPPFP